MDYEEFKEKRVLQDIKIQYKNLNWDFNLDIPNIEDHAKIVLKANPLYYDKNKRWWMWDNKYLYWKETFEPEIINFIKNLFEAKGMSYSTNRTTMLNALKDETQNQIPKQPKETWVQIGRKIYDIANNEVIEPNKEYFIKTIIPYDLGEKEETPFIDQLFKDWKPEIITGENSFEVLQEITAYSMSPVQFLDSFYFLQGKGSDGKSIFLKLLTIMLGDIEDEENKHKNTYHGSIELLTNPTMRFETIRLQNKLLAVLGDGNFGIITNTKILKEASGNTDKIRAELKGSAKNDMDFYNKAKLFCAFNTLPETLDKTKGFYRRCHLTFWNEEFTGDRNIIRELKEEHSEEINNLLKKSLRILREIYKKNKIKGMYGSNQWTKTKDKYEQHSNPLKQFISSEMNEDLGKGVFSKGKFYTEYAKWAEINGFNSFTFKEVEQRLMSMNLDFVKTWIYTMPDGYIFRDKNKAFDYWLNLMQNQIKDKGVKINFDEFLFEKEINKEYLKVFRGYIFTKQHVEPFEPFETTFKSENLHVENLTQKTLKSVSKGSKYRQILALFINPQKKYNFTTLLEEIDIEELELENLLSKMINSGDIMMVDNKYMLVE